jgi:Polyketide cyclase / dehydrase and lipid transport
MWSFEDSVESAGTAAAAWGFYRDVDEWRLWSPAIVWSRIDGPFAVGTKGRSKSPGFPAQRFQLIAVEPEHRFVTMGRLRGVRLLFEHLLDPIDNGVRITHRVMVSGPASGLIARVIGPSVRVGLLAGIRKPATLAG